jgi:hypothetical protein
MKKALMSQMGYIHQIEEPGDDFEIYNGPDATIQWVDAPDDVTLYWTLEWSPAQNTMVWCERDAPPTDPTLARSIAYGEVGEQLDMLFHELQDTGSISASGPWATHIATVKATLDPPPERDEDMTPEEMMALESVMEPSVNSQPKLSNETQPCWVRYTGWHGYSNPDIGTANDLHGEIE